MKISKEAADKIADKLALYDWSGTPISKEEIMNFLHYVSHLEFDEAPEIQLKENL